MNWMSEEWRPLLRRSLRALFQVIQLAILCSCATVDFDTPKSVTYSFQNTEETYLGRLLDDAVNQQQPGTSGFITLLDGIDALAARLLMAESAERSIDAQYYLLKSGTVGYAFLDSLLQAADRGVRVRLLLDDMFTGNYDASMAGLDSHPNFEIRIFNPFAYRSARLLDAMTSFSRINRRMHNKSFTVDNQITLVGGRNIADEYFSASVDANFIDMDIVGIGPVVQDVSDMFDSYWNHVRAAPISAFANIPDDPAAELQKLRDDIEVQRQQILNTEYVEAVRDEVLEFVESDTSVFTWAPYSLAVDSPDKSIRSEAKTSLSITTALSESLLAAEEEIIIISPYFVPLRSGITILSDLQARGVQIKIITNSLAANNQISVHGGYASSRKPLLRNGVKIYEVRADADVSGAQIVAASDAKATLHSKAFIVDKKEIFIGSFNFDPRSANINTELGVIIRSPKIAEEVALLLESVLPTRTYEVLLNRNDQLIWRGLEAGEEVLLNKEPQATWRQRFIAGIFRWLPIRGQL